MEYKAPKIDSYWKVHKNNIKDMKILGLSANYIESWTDEHICIDNYLYISYEPKNIRFGTCLNFWGHMPYNIYSVNWFKEHKFKYQGEFNLRKEKLKKINNESSLY